MMKGKEIVQEKQQREDEYATLCTVSQNGSTEGI
jgi:hypothetical protein